MNERCYDFCGTYHGEIFTEGVINGASWYSLYGTMQDWLYVNTNQLDVTIELGCNQYPPSENLKKYWQYNKKALISYIKQVHIGIKGLVVDDITKKPLRNVTVQVRGIDRNVTTGPDGDFWRLLLPGSYYVQFFLEGYRPSETIHVLVSTHMATILRLSLKPRAAIDQECRPIKI